MNHKIFYTCAVIVSCITTLGSLRAMVEPENLSLPDYILWLDKQPPMMRLLNIPTGEKYLEALKDPQAIEHDQALESSPNYQSFSRYKEAHRKFLFNEDYLAGIYPSEVFLRQLSDLLVRYTDDMPEEVKNALEFEKNELQAAAEAFLKRYWSEDLNNGALMTKLKEKLDDKNGVIKDTFPILHEAIERDDAALVTEYYDALISHAASVAFQKYMETFREDPLNEILLDSDSDGNTALHYLAQKGSIKLARELPHEVIDTLLNRKNALGNTPLHTAIQANNTEFALMLLAHPQILFEEENMQRQTPLSLATKKVQYQVVAEILKKKAERGITGLWPF